MKDKAIAKITEEAMAINDPVAFGIEEHLTEICTNDTVARKILAEDKSLKAIYDKVWAEARKRRTGGKNCVFIPPAEVYAMIDEYYGIHEQAAPSRRSDPNKVDVLDLF
ncbi:MAG: hypothetical protein IJJ31_00990 [Mogibacterium sp.]|nr:hypothetical protein [Mogibacterium sp.]